MSALVQVSPLERVYERSREYFEKQLVGHIDSDEAHRMTHSELERELEKRVRELARQLLQEHIDRRNSGATLHPVRGADGVERRHKRLHDREVETIFGTVSAQRCGYGQPGVDSLHPLDAELNLPKERYSLELRRRAAEEAAKNSFDETVESLNKYTGAQIGKRQVEELVLRGAQDFDTFYQRRQIIPGQKPSGSLLVLTVDGKGIVMRPEDLREQTRKAAEARKHKMGKRLSKGEKKNAKRMATVAAVYTIDPHVRDVKDVIDGDRDTPDERTRPRPEQKRVWASVEKAPEQIILEAFAEARHRDPDGDKTWVALVDGNKEQIRLLRSIARKQRVDLTIVLDIVHVLEYLWAAGRAFHPESGWILELWVRSRFYEILRGKAGYMAGGMRRSATSRGLSEKAREPVDACARYLVNNAPYLHYNQYLEKGFPIATGVIEGACRHLVKDRMDITGARWSLAGAEAVLRLRALRSCGDFDQYWRFHENCEYQRNHQSRYDGGVVPPTTSQIKRKPDLKLIK